MLDAQMKRGLIENCVLAATARGDSYGYKIVKDLSGCVNVTESTLYPILRRRAASRCTPWSTAGGSENFIISRSWGESSFATSRTAGVSLRRCMSLSGEDLKMSRAEFLRLLRWRLAQMPQSEIEKNVAYYDEMFSDMIEDGMTEEEAAARLGDPEEIAKELLRDMPMSELVRSRVRPSGGWTAFSILLAVVLCPIWLPLLIAAAAVVLGLFIALWAVALAVLAVVAALVIGAVTLVGAAIFGYLSVPWGLLTGMALIALGAALLAGLGAVWLVKLIARATSALWHKIKELLIKKEQ